MSELLNHEAHFDNDIATSQVIGHTTVLEALAEDTVAIGPSRSNQSTPSAADADDQ